MRALAPSTITFLPDDRAGWASGYLLRSGKAEANRCTFVHYWDGINNKRLQPCSKLLVFDELRLDVVAVDTSNSLKAHTKEINARKISKALALASQTAAVKTFKVAPLCKVAHTQTSTGGFGGVAAHRVTSILDTSHDYLTLVQCPSWLYPSLCLQNQICAPPLSICLQFDDNQAPNGRDWTRGCAASHQGGRC
jgi:hypothetical protein